MKVRPSKFQKSLSSLTVKEPLVAASTSSGVRRTKSITVVTDTIVSKVKELFRLIRTVAKYLLLGVNRLPGRITSLVVLLAVYG